MEKFNFKEDYILENEVALLRPLVAEDIEYIRPFSKQEPELWQYSLVSAAGEENLQNYINLALNMRSNQKGYPFIVFDKRTNEYVGSTRFYDYSDYHQTASIGYSWYGKNFQGTGLNKNCKYLLLEFLFEIMEIERIEFRADKNNARSIAAMKSIGCQMEGLLRNSYKALSGRRCSVVLSIIKEEWETETKYMLQEKIQQLSY